MSEGRNVEFMKVYIRTKGSDMVILRPLLPNIIGSDIGVPAPGAFRFKGGGIYARRRRNRGRPLPQMQAS